MESGTATPSAPASTPASAPSSTAPATSGAPTASGETKRPTFAQAFAADIATPASPAGNPATSEQPPSATTGAEPAVTPTPGPLPFERHKQILDNAYKERDTFKNELTSLKASLQSPDTQRLQQWAQAYQQNPSQWLAQTVQELAAVRPDLIPEFRSQAARILGQRQQAPPPESMDPDIPVYNEQGQMVAQTYSGDKVKSLIQQAVTDALQREVSPMKEDFAQRKQQQESQQILQHAQQAANSQFEEAKSWDGFLTDPAKGIVDADLVKAFTEHPEWSLERCYISTVVPKLKANQGAKVLEDLQTKAAASTGVNPSGTAITATGRVTSFNDPRLKW